MESNRECENRTILGFAIFRQSISRCESSHRDLKSEKTRKSNFSHQHLCFTKSQDLQSTQYTRGVEGKHESDIAAPLLGAEPGPPSRLPRPPSASHGLCTLISIYPRNSASLDQAPLWASWPIAHPWLTLAHRRDTALRPVQCPTRPFAVVVVEGAGWGAEGDG